MRPNPILKKLGLSDTDRVVILHADDIGMSQATVAAYADLVDFGLLSSAAVMVPCPWFPSVAAFCRATPQVDMGVHLTLNCEYDGYRWGALSTHDPASGLLADDGYLYHRPEDTITHADPAAVHFELQAQVERALAASIDVTHVDSHMGTVLNPRFLASYADLARTHRLPVMIPRADEAGYHGLGLDSDAARAAVRLVEALDDEGVPTIDHLAFLPLNQPQDRIDQAKRLLDATRPGVTHFILHPAQESPELRAITPDDWPSRVADYEAFTSEALRAYVRASGIHIVGYRALRDAART